MAKKKRKKKKSSGLLGLRLFLIVAAIALLSVGL